VHSSIKIANFFLEKAQADKKGLTPLQLMKLVYLAHGWMLGAYGRHLINEPIEAWQYGPVITELYQKIKKFRSSPVSYPIEKTDLSFDNEEKKLLEQIYKTYANSSGVQLSAITHMPDSPWDKVWKLQGRNSLISNDLIMDYYKKKYEELPDNPKV
jgi:uncharacterized phage-associated protein